MLTLPTTYFGPVSWYESLLRADSVQEEVMESFPKQTYRNRCTIITPNGPLTLSVPVQKAESKQFTRDVEISYQTHWQHQHWMAIVSAYKHTPYFDYYQDYLRPFYEKRTRYLVDLNAELHSVVMSLLYNEMPLSPRPSLVLTNDWQGENLEVYWGDGISILDPLFHYGPEALYKLLHPQEESLLL